MLREREREGETHARVREAKKNDQSTKLDETQGRLDFRT